MVPISSVSEKRLSTFSLARVNSRLARWVNQVAYRVTLHIAAGSSLNSGVETAATGGVTLSTSPDAGNRAAW